MNDPYQVRGLLRGLAVLRTLNEHKSLTARELSKYTGLPRPTIYRILNTLVAAGYVASNSESGVFRLTQDVRSLSDGYEGNDSLARIASPALEELDRQVVWPTNIATFDKNAMVLRETTHLSSPLSINQERVGFRAPMLGSSLGIAYLAFCDKSECEMILRIIAAGDFRDAGLASKPAVVDAILAETRLLGYAIRQGGLSPKTGSIAVPVMCHGAPAATINMHYILSALTVNEVVARYLKPLQNAAERVSQALLDSGFDEGRTVGERVSLPQCSD